MGLTDSRLKIFNGSESIGMKGRFISRQEQGFISVRYKRCSVRGWLIRAFAAARKSRRLRAPPHVDEGSTVYPGTCRGKFASIEEATRQTGKPAAVRFAVPSGVVEFEDQFAGRQQFDVKNNLGDFVIAKADGSAAYQLAVVVDDADMGIDAIVRGDDLLDSTPRQILLYHALGLSNRIPRYWHLPLVVGKDGRRLAKRHGDTRIGFYLDQRRKARATARAAGKMVRSESRDARRGYGMAVERISHRKFAQR